MSRAAPRREGPRLLAASAAGRLLGAVLLGALIWAGFWWATGPVGGG